MNILLASDDNYIYPAIVLIDSVFENNKQEDINIFYMFSYLTESSKRKLKKIVELHSGKITFIQVDDTMFNDAPVCAHFTKETYFRFFACVLLPQNMDRVLYLDPDIVVNGDIKNFYSQTFKEDDKEFSFVVCEEKELSKDESLKKTLNIPSNKRYFNAGVLLINLNLLRQTYDINTIFHYIENYKEKIKYQDQDILNALYWDNVKFDDYYMYNYMPHSIKNNKNLHNARIIHYAGPDKPWKFGYKYSGKDIYKKYVKHSGAVFWFYKSQVKNLIINMPKTIKKSIKRKLYK